MPLQKVRGSLRDGAQPVRQTIHISDSQGPAKINQQDRDLSRESSNAIHVESKQEKTFGDKFTEATANAGKTFVTSFASSFASSVAASVVDSYFNSGSSGSNYATSRGVDEFQLSYPSYRTRDPHAPRGYINPNMTSVHDLLTNKPGTRHSLFDSSRLSQEFGFRREAQHTSQPQSKSQAEVRPESQPEQPEATTLDQETEEEKPFFDLFADNPEANMLREQISNTCDYDTRPDSDEVPLMDAVPSEEDVADFIQQTATNLNDFIHTTKTGIEDFSGNAQHAQECLDLVKTTTADFLALATQAQEQGDIETAGILSDFSSNFLQLGKNLVGILKTPVEKLGNSSRWLYQELQNDPQKVFLYFGLRIARGVDLIRCIQGGGIPLDFLEGQDVTGDYYSLSTADLGMAIIQRMVIGGTFKGLGRIAKLAGKAKLGDFSKGVKLGSRKGFGKGKVAATGSAKISLKGLIKKEMLPTTGKIRYVPQKNFNLGDGLPRVAGLGRRRAFKDRFGNIWQEGPSRTAGETIEWDVQLSRQGKQQLGWASKSGKYINVSLKGRITH